MLRAGDGPHHRVRQVEDLTRITSVSSLWSNIVSRARGHAVKPMLLMPERLCYADIPWTMRTDWGGHDPASPFAELIINTHSTIWPVAIFIFCSAAYMVKK
ncbi:hypothetical protein FOZ61_009220 [Perkinsus olseni]|uniref:Uncharacterized protein n=1 Tax=Perkinsus olseni TaxID=32597 RepID=A0A7J6M5D0_PEROL|nr:hypothetical protein FOZ61_009220 [Perkinsus olseni]